MKNFFKQEKGMSVVEILIAIGVVATVSASVAQFVSTITALSIEGERRVVALGLAREGLVAARSVRNKDFNTLNSYADNNFYHPVIQNDNWVFQSDTENINNFYYRRVKMENVCRVDATGEIDNDDIVNDGDDDIKCDEGGVTRDNGTIKVVSQVTWPADVSAGTSKGACGVQGVEYSGGCLGPPGSSWPHEIILITYLTDWK